MAPGRNGWRMKLAQTYGISDARARRLYRRIDWPHVFGFLFMLISSAVSIGVLVWLWLAIVVGMLRW
jgi:hypothetical protein